ncbi:GFA family protein [Mesorhizobium sp. BR115XR7A]|uniref:GFA family protein n=1 Tax=Mesorhizobium sp. BR115XR7A TaxID=2876645 RepID=UPI001CCB3CFB|nr:GFA family protein [Mesorhizobium sp. BR115XR7A]MBZ9908193.1 GFA family protein [Mesorhizobium sp. BR115XR7A]MBZ9930578.1 GFA family protein [Mesorhizobium sp. BR1-1-5]
MLYKGSCHCGKVAFEVEGELESVVRCNCSICARKGALLWAVPHDKLTLVAWGDDLGRYTFGETKIAHRFCRTCGIHPFAEDTSEDGAHRNRSLEGRHHQATGAFSLVGRCPHQPALQL